VSTRRVVLVSLLVAGAGLGLAAAYATGSWRDLWLGLLAEAVGAAFIVLFVDVLFERSEARERDGRRRAALHELGSTLRQLQAWLVGMFMAPGTTSGTQEADDLSASLNGLVDKLATMGSFLEGMERYILRDGPTSPVFAYEGITEVTAESAGWLVSELQDFLYLYGEQCERYGVPVHFAKTGT